MCLQDLKFSEGRSAVQTCRLTKRAAAHTVNKCHVKRSKTHCSQIAEGRQVEQRDTHEVQPEF